MATRVVKDIQWYGATPERTKKLHDLIKTFKQLVRANQGKFRQFPEIERALSSISISLIELEDFINDPQRFPPPQGDTQYEEKKEAILTHIRFLWGKTFTNPNPNIEVKYRGQEGIDAGGLSRDFMNELMLGLIDRGNFVDHPRQPGIHDPETTAHFDPTQPFPSLDEGATNRFVQIGQLMMHCYRSCTAQEGRPDRFCITGRHFHESIFHAALCLTFDEVKTPFSNLSEQTKLKMARELLTHQEGGMSEAFSQAISCYEKLLNGSQLEKNEMKTLIANLEMTEALTLTEQDKQTLETDPNGFFNTHKDQMKGALANMVFGAVGHRLAPVHAMAQGMQLFMKNSKDSWEALCQRGGTVVSDTVQGKVDPQAVAAAITLSEASQADESMKKKVAWLKEWVQTLNPDEIKAFLQWVTGSQGFTGKRIIITKYHTPSPIPFTHTCFSQIDISPGRNTKRGESNDDTKEGFIAIVKSAIAASQQIVFEENVTR